IGGGGLFGIFDLYSECVNGKRVYARVHVAGSEVGFGAAVSGSGSSITLEDDFSTPDYHALEGVFEAVWAQAALGGGYGIGAVQIGDARVIPAYGPIAGIDLSIGGSAGRAWVVQHEDMS